MPCKICAKSDTTKFKSGDDIFSVCWCGFDFYNFINDLPRKNSIGLTLGELTDVTDFFHGIDFNDIKRFFDGKTGGVTENGELVFYPDDVAKAIRYSIFKVNKQK